MIRRARWKILSRSWIKELKSWRINWKISRVVLQSPGRWARRLGWFWWDLPVLVCISGRRELFCLTSIDTISTGKGTQAPKIKEKFSCCHLVRSFLMIAWLSGWWEILISSRQPAICFDPKSQRRHLSVGKPRRLWTRVDLLAMTLWSAWSRTSSRTTKSVREGKLYKIQCKLTMLTWIL